MSIRSLFAFLLAAFSLTAGASVSFQLDPSNGAIAGQPNTTVGWGFTLQNTENFLVVTSANFETDSGLGTFTDFMTTPANFFIVGPAIGGSTTWSQVFNEDLGTGLGSYSINPLAALSDLAYGQIVLTYDLFSRSPLDPLFNPDTDTLSLGNSLSRNASVSVAAVPLPASLWLLGSSTVLIGFMRREG